MAAFASIVMCVPHKCIWGRHLTLRYIWQGYITIIFPDRLWSSTQFFWTKWSLLTSNWCFENHLVAERRAEYSIQVFEMPTVHKNRVKYSYNALTFDIHIGMAIRPISPLVMRGVAYRKSSLLQSPFLWCIKAPTKRRIVMNCVDLTLIFDR